MCSRHHVRIRRRASCLRSCCLVWVLFAVAVSSTSADQHAPPDAGKGEPGDALPLDRRPLELSRRPGEDTSSGQLGAGGYCGRGAKRRKEYYELEKDGAVQATAEIVVHSPDYAYVVHDLLGTFRAAWLKHMSRRVHGPADSQFLEFITWPGSSDGKQMILLRMPDETFQPGRGLGAVAWYREDQARVTTVFVYYEGLTGLPVGVIDAKLAEFPSDVKLNDPRVANWQANDLQKWVTMLQTKRYDDASHTYALVALRQYDPAAFGLLEARMKRNDAEAYAEVVEQVIANIQAHVDAHPELQVRAEEASEDKAE